jgi:uncharacterized protein (DUF362 family)
MIKQLKISNEREIIRGSVEEIVRDLTSVNGLKNRIFLKGNMYVNPYSPSIGTNPLLLDELARQLEMEGAEVLVGDIQSIYSPGLDQYSSELTYGNFVDLNRETELTSVVLDEELTVRFPSLLLEDNISVVNVPVLKTHAETGLSACIKNFMGILPKTKDRESIHNIDLLRYIRLLYLGIEHKVAYHIVDAIVSQEGEGPAHGNPVETNYLFHGKDGEEIDKYLSGLIVPQVQVEYLNSGFSGEVGLRPFTLSAPRTLDKSHYSGTATSGHLGVFYTMFEQVQELFKEEIFFVFPDGEAKQGRINIGVNSPNNKGIDYHLHGNPPSRRQIRSIFGIKK